VELSERISISVALWGTQIGVRLNTLVSIASRVQVGVERGTEQRASLVFLNKESISQLPAGPTTHNRQ
jgi:hypothetical protein